MDKRRLVDLEQALREALHEDDELEVTQLRRRVGSVPTAQYSAALRRLQNAGELSVRGNYYRLRTRDDQYS